MRWFKALRFLGKWGVNLELRIDFGSVVGVIEVNIGEIELF